MLYRDSKFGSEDATWEISNSYKKLLTRHFDCTNKLHILQRPQPVGKMYQTFSVRRVERNPHFEKSPLRLYVFITLITF